MIEYKSRESNTWYISSLQFDDWTVTVERLFVKRTYSFALTQTYTHQGRDLVNVYIQYSLSFHCLNILRSTLFYLLNMNKYDNHCSFSKKNEEELL